MTLVYALPLPGLAHGEYAVKNSEAAFAKLYDGTKPPAGVDGEYIDSAEGYLTPPLDFNRGAFAASETPLVFSNDDDHRPALFKGLTMYEYVRRTAGRVWSRGRYMMANGVPGRWPWLPAYVDVGGTETGWIDGEGRWRPVNALVASADARVFAEQFGDRYATVFNSARETLRARIAAKTGAKAAELVGGGEIAFGADGSAVVEMKPDEVLVLDFAAAAR